MANYKSFSGNWEHQLYYEISHIQNTRENTTTFYISNIQIGGGWEINYRVAKNVVFSVNGEQKSLHIDRLDLQRRAWKTLGSLSWTIPHEKNGNKSFDLTISCDLSSIAYGQFRIGTLSYSEEISLPRILRGAELTSTIPTELSTSNATFNATCVIHNSSFKTVMELSYTNPINGGWEGLGSSFEDRNNVTFNVARTHLDKLVSLFKNQDYANITFTLASRDRNTNQNISVIQKTIKLTFGNEYNPNITLFELEEQKNEVLELALNENEFIEEISEIQTAINADAKQNATITNYEISFNNQKSNHSNGTILLQNLPQGRIEVMAKVTDSRGKQASITKIVNVLPYHRPRIEKFKVIRPINAPLKPIVSMDATISSLNQFNSFTILIESSIKGQNTWNLAYKSEVKRANEFKLENHFLLGIYESRYAYEFRVTLQDKFSSVILFDDIGLAIRSATFIPKGLVVGGQPTNKKLHGLQVYGKIIDEDEKLYLKQGMRHTFEIVNNFSSSVNHYGGAYGKAMYCKDAFDRVFIQGNIKINGAPTGIQKLFTLPEGYRPKTVKFFTVIDDALNQGTVEILPSGLVQSRTVKNTNFICLDGITFVEGE